MADLSRFTSPFERERDEYQDRPFYKGRQQLDQTPWYERFNPFSDAFGIKVASTANNERGLKKDAAYALGNRAGIEKDYGAQLALFNGGLDRTSVVPDYRRYAPVHGFYAPPGISPTATVDSQGNTINDYAKRGMRPQRGGQDHIYLTPNMADGEKDAFGMLDNVLQHELRHRGTALLGARDAIDEEQINGVADKLYNTELYSRSSGPYLGRYPPSVGLTGAQKAAETINEKAKARLGLRDAVQFTSRSILNRK